MTPDLDERLRATLGTSFTVDREVGGGGMSRVYLATDRTLGRRVVVKLLAPSLAEDVNAERFEREVRTMARLQHPHIVPLLSAGRLDDLPYYIMPYVEGESARSLIEEGQPHTIARVVGILRDTARALEFAHRHGVVHRDIKPDNILVTDNASVVCDFGIAKAVQAARTHGGDAAALTQMGVVVGTPAYMAPEQIVGGGDVDNRADIYAFGVTAYELLTGKLPFNVERTTKALLNANVSERPIPIQTCRADIPAPLAELVMRCLAKEPADRPASAGELLRALDESTGSHRALGRQTRFAIGAAAVILAGAFAGVWWQQRADAATVAPSVAVLPFHNLSGDTASEYFSDGITEQLVGDLGRANGLGVASRAAGFAYKGRTADPREVAASLNTSAIVTGSVRRAGKQFRVEAELVDGRSGERLWSDRYDRTIDDVFAVQEEVARAITAALKVSLLPRRSAAQQTDAETYDLYLRARHQMASRSGVQSRALRALDSALVLLRLAIARDSTYAPAWGLLADVHRLSAEYRLPRSVLPSAKEAAQRAVHLDPTDLSASVALANALLNVDWNWEAAEREYKRAIALHPNAPEPYAPYAGLLMAWRRFDEALDVAHRGHAAELRRATDTIARRAVYARRVAQINTLAGRRAQMDSAMAEATRLEPNSAFNQYIRGWTLFRWDPRAAARAMEQARPTLGNRLPFLSHLGVAYGHAGQTDSTRSIIAQLLQRSRTEYVPKDQLFTLYLSLGDEREALRWLEQAVEERHWWLPYLNAHPMVERLRGDPRYRALMRRVGVPESAL